MKDYSTIIQPIVTEKSANAQTRGQYTFLVQKTATKIDIKHAVKRLYGVDVDNVRTMVAPKKVRLIKGRYQMTKRPVMKKAIVTLKNKKTIDPNKLKGASKKETTKEKK
jgi:large subunit ribosomal protein L23